MLLPDRPGLILCGAHQQWTRGNERTNLLACFPLFALVRFTALSPLSFFRLRRGRLSTDVSPPDGTISPARISNLLTISCRLVFQTLISNSGVVLSQRMFQPFEFGSDGIVLRDMSITSHLQFAYPIIHMKISLLTTSALLLVSQAFSTLVTSVQMLSTRSLSTASQRTISSSKSICRPPMISAASRSNGRKSTASLRLLSVSNVAHSMTWGMNVTCTSRQALTFRT
jgi:hypothetical protein